MYLLCSHNLALQIVKAYYRYNLLSLESLSWTLSVATRIAVSDDACNGGDAIIAHARGILSIPVQLRGCQVWEPEIDLAAS